MNYMARLNAIKVLGIVVWAAACQADPPTIDDVGEGGANQPPLPSAADLPSPPRDIDVPAVDLGGSAQPASSTDSVLSESDSVHAIPAKPDVASSYYPWVTQLSFGPRLWVGTDEDDEIQAIQHRAAVTHSEIYSSLHIEQITWGMEGCCATLTAHSWDMWEMHEWFDIQGEISGVGVTSWPSADSFVFTLRGRQFVVEILDGPAFTVEER